MQPTTIDHLADLLKTSIAAQSMLLASVLRPLIIKGVVSEAEFLASLAATEQAALERRTPETPALIGLIYRLRRDLGLCEANCRDDA